MDPTRRVVCPTLFPHIIEDILQDVCRSTLINLRATSRAFKIEADKRLGEQLSLRHEYLEYLSVSAPSGQRIPGLTRIPLVKNVFNRERAKILSYTANTRVVEMEGAVRAPFDARDIAPVFPKLETLRITTERGDNYDYTQSQSPWAFMRYFPFPCQTVVLFFHECANGGFLVAPEDIEGEAAFPNDDTFLVPRGDSQKLPPSVTTLVINLKGSEVPLNQLYTLFRAVKTVVIVFPEYRLNRHPTPHSFDLQYLLEHTRSMIWHNKSTQFVFVGLGKTAVKLRNALKRDFFSWGRRGETLEELQQRWEDFIGRVEFVSRYAYADEVEDVDIHLVERLDDREVWW